VNIAIVANRTAPISRTLSMDFDALAAKLSIPTVGAKDGIGILPATIKPGPRTGERVEQINFLMLDVEADAVIDQATGEKRITGPEAPNVEEMRAELALHGYQTILSTTHSHTPEHPRYRLAMALDRPLQPKELRTLGLHVAALLGISDCIDKKALEPARLYYLPRVPEDRLTDFRSFKIGTKPLPADQLLAEAAKIEKAQKSALATRRTGKSGSVINEFNAGADVATILEQHGYIKMGRNRYLYPGSTTGTPGVRILDSGCVYSSHGGDPLNDGHAHDAFDLFRILTHGGDIGVAVKDAARLMGLNTSAATASKVAEVGNEDGQDAIFPSASFSLISFAELQTSAITPRVIVPGYLYADVRSTIAAGGTGKTTKAIFEAVILALGRALWGRDTVPARRTVIITREDRRALLVARLREIMRALELSRTEIEQVLQHVLIVDLSGERFRLSAIIEGNVEAHLVNIGWLVEKLASYRPDWLIFDPLVSFGVGESRVNDAEQSLIEAFRILRNDLDCCVEGLHHSGKASARDKVLDQYAGRGGSALADGSRMVAVLQPLTADEWLNETGKPLEDDETGMVMALPKLSYTAPQESVFIRRKHYQFAHERVIRISREESDAARCDQLLRFLTSEYEQGRRYSSNDLDHSHEKLGLTRNEIRAAASALKVAGKVIYHAVSGKAGSHFVPQPSPRFDGEGMPK
jgi:RecA-family ATPase